MKMKVPIVFIAAVMTVNISEAKSPKVVNPGQGVCKEAWANKLKDEASVQLAFEFLDKNGNPLSAAQMEKGKNPVPYCSASVVRVGKEQKLKIVSAGHCAKKEFQTSPGGIYKRPDPLPVGLSPEEEKAQLYKHMPPGAHAMRIVAKIAGRGVSIPMTTIGGPQQTPTANDKNEVYRSNDYAVLDGDTKVLDGLMAGKAVEKLCDPSMAQKDIDAAVVIGFGVTNSGDKSPVPLCGQQKIANIAGEIITIDKYKPGKSGACPGDSGGGLWAKTKSGERCLAGVVSGPKTASMDPTAKVETALQHCTQEGLEAVFASVYQQQEELEGYMNGLAPVNPDLDQHGGVQK